VTNLTKKPPYGGIYLFLQEVAFGANQECYSLFFSHFIVPKLGEGERNFSKRLCSFEE
jgi:hypothetical protein